jgi:hypothetical protein
MRAEKRDEKEAVCQQVIVDQPQKQSVEPLECDTTTHLVKAKNVVAHKLMEKPKTKLRTSQSKKVIQKWTNCTITTAESNKQDGLKKTRSKAVTTKALAQKARKKQKGSH